MNKSLDELAKEHGNEYEQCGPSVVEAAEFSFKAGYAARVEREVKSLKQENEVMSNKLKQYDQSFLFYIAQMYEFLNKIEKLREEKAE